MTQNGFHADVKYEMEIEKLNHRESPIDFKECRVAVIDFLDKFQFYSVDELAADSIVSKLY